ncbi:MAG: phenylpyruvate tautomerase MIF-related protein [Thiohalomonadales bacterium]|nr:phenylpyruvate tautomerase MIF-related protein [Thiohalomonadales bacterium]
MPYLKIQTNQTITAEQAQALISKASTLVATELGKPEKYVMVALAPPVPMSFAGSDAPTAYLELKSIGLPSSQTTQLSQALCELIDSELAISKDRVYIEFADAPRAMWGWNGSTF